MSGLPEPDHVVELPDGRRLAFDDRGDPAGMPVLFFHGTPDTRLARHPDDSIAAGHGLRVIAADRPGLGGSDPDPDATPASVADDHRDLLDHLDVDRVHVLAWSAGTIPALAFAGSHPGRARSLTLVAPLVPADAYDAEGVLEGADDGRRLFADLLGTVSPDEAGRELAMWLVPPQIDEGLAREMLTDTVAALEHVPGAGDAMVAALRGSVSRGVTGIEREIAGQATPLGPLLDRVTAPVTVHSGTADTTTPPGMARWLADRLGAGHVTHEDGHLIAVTRWHEILRSLVD